MGTNQKTPPYPNAPQSVGPSGVPLPNDIAAEQAAIDAFNRTVAGALARRGPQTVKLTANAAEFQPTERHDPGPLPAAEYGDFRYQPGEPGTPAGSQGDTGRPT